MYSNIYLFIYYLIQQISPGGELLLQRAFPLPGVLMIHDFVMAGRFLVVFLRCVG